MDKIGDVFAKKRIEKGWTLQETADKVGLDISQYHCYETNKHIPNAFNFLCICEALDLEFSDFRVKN